MRQTARALVATGVAPGQGAAILSAHRPEWFVANPAAMAAGAWISAGFTALGLTLPAYIGAMLAAAAIRNLDDATGWVRLPHRLLDDLGNAALSLFIAMALMTLKLWEIANLALPLALILAAQVALVSLVALLFPIRAVCRGLAGATPGSAFTSSFILAASILVAFYYPLVYWTLGGMEVGRRSLCATAAIASASS